MSEALDNISREFRSAVLAGDHALAERLAVEYTEKLRMLWESLRAENRAASEIPRRALELLAWARQMTIVQRALSADQLSVIQKVCRYAAAGAQTRDHGAVRMQA